MSIYKVYSIGRTWSWSVMSAPACFCYLTIQRHRGTGAQGHRGTLVGPSA